MKGHIKMYYHNITHDDMLNGSGLRVVLWCSGCEHHCNNCQNPQTWDFGSGIPFDENAKEEIFSEIKKDYISGITFSGGDPLAANNLETVLSLIKEIRLSFPNKNIWIYTGYTFEEIQLLPKGLDQESMRFNKYNKMRQNILENCDVLVDGRYIDELRDITLKWRGSSNQRVIDVKRSLKQGKIILWENQ